jgi:hypothetical protein
MEIMYVLANWPRLGLRSSRPHPMLAHGMCHPSQTLFGRPREKNMEPPMNADGGTIKK